MCPLWESNKRYIGKFKENNSWSPIAQLLGDSQQSNYESPSKHWDYYSLCSSTNWNKLEKTKTKTFHSTAGEWHLVLRRYPGTSSIYSQLNNKILEDFVFLYLKQVLLKSYELLWKNQHKTDRQTFTWRMLQYLLVFSSQTYIKIMYLICGNCIRISKILHGKLFLVLIDQQNISFHKITRLQGSVNIPMYSNIVQNTVL